MLCVILMFTESCSFLIVVATISAKCQCESALLTSSFANFNLVIVMTCCRNIVSLFEFTATVTLESVISKLFTARFHSFEVMELMLVCLRKDDNGSVFIFFRFILCKNPYIGNSVFCHAFTGVAVFDLIIYSVVSRLNIAWSCCLIAVICGCTITDRSFYASVRQIINSKCMRFSIFYTIVRSNNSLCCYIFRCFIFTSITCL